MTSRVRLIGGVAAALLALTHYTSAQAPPINVRTLEDRDHVTVMELSGGYDRQPDSSRDYEVAIRQAIAREFLRQHQDDYDFIVAFTGFPFNLGSDQEGTRVGGRYYAIKNDVQGIGQELFDHSNAWGSTGRLQGFIDMGALGSLVTDPTDPLFERTLGTLAHEVGHRWGAHLRFQNPDQTPNHSLLGSDGHWSFFLQTHNSVLYGNDWRDNGDGSFTSTGRSRSYYSPLDLYAMGLLDRSAVPPFFLIEGAAGDPARLPETGATVTGTRRAVSIDEVIAAEGEREPDAAAAPRRFKIAFVYLVRPGHTADGAQLRAINNVREGFATRMLILTGGAAAFEVFPDAPDPAVTEPAPVLPPSSGPRTAPVDLAQGVSWLLSRQSSSGRLADSLSTAVRDTAAAVDLLAGVPAAFTARQTALAWLSSTTAGSNVDTVARRMAALAPQFPPADAAFLSTAQHALGGWGLRAGDEPDAFDTALALAAAPAADHSAAITRLIALQLPDGSWPLQPGGSGSILATAAALRLAGRFASAPLNEALGRASTWLLSRQNSDGGFGEAGSTAYETALALLHAARVSSTPVDVRWAVEFLRRGQLADGSWNESVYETALAIRALQIADLPNIALVADSLVVAPADPVDGAMVSLSASVENTGATDLANVVVRFYDGHPADGGLPIGEDVIIASLPAQARVPIAAQWNTTDAAGTHTIVAIADPALLVAEANEADNVLTRALTVRPAPAGADLAVSNADLVFTPDQLRSVPQAQTIDARVSNLGRTAAPGIQVAVFAGDPAAGGVRVGETVVTVPARGFVAVTINLTVDIPGERRYFVVADAGHAVTEADETNNVASRILPVSSSVDLFVTPGSVTLSENPIALGRDLQIGATVGNGGTADVFGARVRVSIDAPGGALDVATLTVDLPAGQTRTVSATWRTSRVLAAAPVVIQIDPLNAFPETSESNNQASTPVSVPASTDANLRITHQELAASTPVLQGGSTTIQIPVRNTGFADAADVEVAFYLGVPGAGGVQIGATQRIALIAAGGQAAASIVWSQITTFGDKLIYVVVDPAGTVTEFDEQDNTAFITVDVLSLPDLAVSSASLSFAPPFPRNGEPVNVSALVSNLGEQSAAAVVQLFLGSPAAGGLPIGPPQVVTVEGGAFASVNAPLDALTIGASTIFVVVDATNQVLELDESNNLAAKTIGVQDGSFFFTNPYFSPNGDDVQDTTEFFFRLTAATAAAVQAIDRRGHVAREFVLETSMASSSVVWDGRDDRGRIVADGEYAFALRDSAGTRLASATVVVDNNNLPVGEAVGSKYLLRTRLTNDGPGPSTSVFWQPSLRHEPAAWLADDSGLVTFVSTQLLCVSAFGNYFQGCTNYQFLSSPQTGVYVTSPDGQSRTRITPDNWTTQSFVGTPPNQDTYGTQVIGAYPSNDGRKVFIGTRQYRYFRNGSTFFFEYRTGIELWVVNTDGSGLVRVGVVSGDRLVPQSMFPGIWSPDNTRIAVPNYTWLGNGYSYHLDLVNADGSGTQQRLQEGSSVNSFLHGTTWSPGGDRIVYAVFSGTSYVWYAVNPDDNGRLEIAIPPDTFWGFGNNGIEGPAGKWLDHERFANLLTDQHGRGSVWVMSATGALPQRVTPIEKHVLEAVVHSGSGVAYTDHIAQFGPGSDSSVPPQQSTGIWLVDADGRTERIYPASAHNGGIRHLAWSPDGRRIAFTESVITDFRVCDHIEGQFFCGDSFSAFGVVDARERTATVVPSRLQDAFDPLGFFPDGNSFLVQDWSADTFRLLAVSAADGATSVLVDDPQAIFGCCIGTSNMPLTFTPSGKYYLYGTRDSAVGQRVWLLGSLLNLTTDLSFQRRGAMLEIRGTAEDRNFLNYTLEATPAGAPDQWVSIAAPSDTPVFNGVLAEWIPPSEGTFLVRLTATDLAGNRAVARRRITWGLAPTIANVVVAERAFSPNGDGARDAATLTYLVLGPVNLEFSIFDAANRRVRTIAQSHSTIGPAAMIWDGRNDAAQIVADGIYRIHVLDYDFFVTVDNTPPDVRLALGSAFRTAAEKTACVAAAGGVQCSRFAGPVVDSPVHALMGRAADRALASWVLDVGTGSNPTEWVTVDRGSDVLLARTGSNQPIAPVADTTVRTLTNLNDVVLRRYRLTAVDQAGNVSVAVSEFAPQEVIVHAWDGVPIPTERVLPQARGPHVLAVQQTVRSPQSLRVQVQPPGSTVWNDGPAVPATAAQLDLPWNNASLAAGRTYTVRVAARDSGGADYFSNSFQIHADQFEMTRVETDARIRLSRAHGVASLLEDVTNIRLVLTVPGDPDIGVGAAAFSDDVSFAVGVAPNPAISSCSGEQVEARFRGVGTSGRVYYSDPFVVTRFGGLADTCTSPGTGVTLSLTATRVVAGCGQPNPERVRIRFDAQGYRPGSLRLAVQDVPHGLLRDVPGVSTVPFEMDVDTSQLAAGVYQLRGSALPLREDSTAPAQVLESFVVDRAPPTAQITYPASNTLVCPARSGAAAIIAIEGVAQDANFDHYEISYGSGDDPQIFLPIFPSSPAEVLSSRAPRQGLLHNWDVRNLSPGIYTLCLKVVDKGGNAECRKTTFTIPPGARISDVGVSPRLFSPNADGNIDSVALSFTLDAAALISARVFAIENGQRAATPVRTLLANVQHLAGSNTLLWDGLTDLAAPAPDGAYHIVLTSTDACGGTISAFALAIVDNTRPSATINTPAPGETGRVLVDVRGSVADANFEAYQLEVGAGASPAIWTLIASGRSPLQDALLGQWNNHGVAGDYSLRLTASDAAGNTETRLVAIVVNATDPLIDSLSATPLIFSPNGDGRADTATVAFTTTTAAQVSIDVMSGSAVIAALRPQAELPAGSHTVVWTGLDSSAAPFADGEFMIRVSASAVTDPGRTQTETIAITVDTTAPVVMVSGPAEGAYLTGDVVVRGTVSDANIDVYHVRFGAAATGPTILLDEGGQNRTAHSFGTLSGLADGAHAIRVTASDRALNVTTVDRQFSIDGESPLLSLIAPVTGTIIGSDQPVVDVRGSVLETNLEQWTLRFGAGLAPVSWTTLVTQNTPPATAQLTSWNTSGLADGTYTLSLIATDRAGTASDERVQVVVDHTAPVAVIRQPADGARLSAASPILGDVTDANFVSATLELSAGSPASAFEYVTLTTLDAPVANSVLHDLSALPGDGVYTLRLRVDDAAGHRSEAVSTFFVDTEPPAPPSNLAAFVENRRDARLTWTASDEPDVMGYHVYRGAARLTPAPVQALNYLDAALPDGVHRYTVSVVDAAGLESGASNAVSVLIDVTAPAAVIQLPVDGQRVADLIDIRGTAASPTDFREYRILVGSGATPAAFTLVRRSPAPVTSGLLAQIDSILHANDSTITIRLEAEDLEGNVAADIVTVTIDNSLPATPVMISATASAATVTATWQPVADPDVAGYLLYRNQLLANVRQIVVGNHTPYLLPGPSYVDAGLFDGSHDYYVVAVDRAGNRSVPSNAIAVTVETRAPRATIVSPASGFRTDVPVIVEATSPDIDIATVQFQFKALADAAWSDLNAPDVTAPFTTTWDPRTLPNGTYQFRAVATDANGNTDPAPPVITIVHGDVTAPAAPTNLIARVDGSTVSLSWIASTSDDVNGYVVLRRLEGGTASPVSGTITTTAFQDTGVGDGQYFYSVTARDASGNVSSPSAETAARTYTVFLTTPSVCLADPAASLFGSGAAAGAVVTLFVERDMGEVTAGTTVAAANGAFQFTNVGLNSGANRFSAEATDASGNRSNRSPVLQVTFSGAPGAVAGLAAEVNDRQVTLTWLAAANAASYIVRRLNTDSTTDTTFTEFDVSDGRHTYSVTAVNHCSVEGPAAQIVVEVGDATAPAPPANLVATADDSDVVLQWMQSPDADVAGYIVYRLADDSTWQALTAAPLPANTYRDTRLPDGVHRYRVTAVDQFGNESAPSNEATATTVDTQAPDPPALVFPTDSARPITLPSTTTAVAGITEPGAHVALVRQGVAIATTQALREAEISDFELDGEFDSEVAFHAGTKRIAGFARQAGTSTTVLTVIDVQSRQSRIFRNAHFGGSVAFSADGARVAYTSTFFGNALGVVELATGTFVEQLALPDHPVGLALAPDATRAAVLLHDGDRASLWLADFAADTVTLAIDESSGIQAPRWSPDGRWIAYLNGDGQLRLFEVPSATVRDVGTTDDETFSFSPDGTRLAFTTERDGVSELWIHDVASAASAEVPDEAEGRMHRYDPRFAPNGALGYFVQPLDFSIDEVFRVRDLTTGEILVRGVEDVDDDSFWMTDWTLVAIDNSDVELVNLPGTFRFDTVTLAAGLNLLSAIATDLNDNSSAPAQPIAITVDTSPFPDLVIGDRDLFVYPAIPAPGDRVRLAATVHNSGTAAVANVTLAFFASDDAGTLIAIGSPLSLGTIAAGGQATTALDWIAVGGRRRLLARVDPFGAIAEASESNNTAERLIDVLAPGVPAVQIAIDRASYQPADTVRLDARAINPAAAADFTLRLTIEDAAGEHTATLLDLAVPAFSYATRDVNALWPTSGVLAGSYRARATWRRADGFTVSATAPFTIEANEQIAASLATDKSSYLVGDTARLAGVVRNLSANVVIADVAAAIEVRDAGGATLLHHNTAIGTLLLGAQSQVTAEWPALAPGSYTSTITVRRGSQQLAQATRNFTVAGIVELTGTLSPTSSRIGLGHTVDVTATAVNRGSLLADGTTLRLRVVGAGSPAPVRSFTRLVDIAPGAAVAWPMTIDTAGLAVGTYTLYFEAERSSSTTALAVASLAMADVVAPDVQILAPAADAVTSGDVAVVARAGDDASAIVRVEVRLDGGAWQQMAPADPAGGTYRHQFAAAALAGGPHTFEVRAIDAAGNDDLTSATDRNPASRSITVSANRLPVASAGAAQSVPEGTAVTLDGSGSSDADGDPLTYRWRQIDGAAVSLDQSNPARPAFVAPEVTRDGDTLLFELIVNDGTADSAPAFVTVTVTNVNRPPVTTDQSVTVDEDGTAPITIAATDPDSDPLTFEVQPASHGTVTGTAPNLVYTPAPNYHGTDAFDVVIRDPAGLSATARVSLTIASVNDAPVANAGTAQTIAEGAAATLDGSASADADGDALSYSWTQIDGAAVGLDLTNPARPAFVAPEVPRDGSTLIFQLIVNDGTADSAPALVTVTVTNVNRPPAAADQSVTVAEDGTASITIAATDPDSDPLTFEVQPALHGTVTGTAPDLIYTPAPDYHGADAFDVVVRDPGGLAATARVSISVTAVNDAPIAVAGSDRSVNEGDAVTLDGSASMDPEGGSLSYQWTQIAGPAVDLQNAATVAATFTAPATDATLTFSLVVFDGELESAPSQVNITVTSLNRPPVAEAGAPQRVGGGVTVSLDGSLSFDPDGDALTFAWTQVAGLTVDLAGADTSRPAFTSPHVGVQTVLTFELTVSDGTAAATDRVDITIDPENLAPIANAGPDHTVKSGEVVVLDGRASTDPEGAPLTYRWNQIAGTSVQLSDAFAAKTVFEAPSVLPPGETLSFELVVNDGVLDSAPDRVDIRVLAAAALECHAVAATPALLWPPNHKLVPIAFVGTGGAKLTVITVTQDEPTAGTGSGDTSPDAVIQGDSLLLRAERAGSGNGRVYQIRFRLRDDAGQTCTGSIQVGVPKSAHATPVDDGQEFDSTKKSSKKK